MPNLAVSNQPIPNLELGLHDQARGPTMLDRHGDVEQVVKPSRRPVPDSGLGDNDVKPPVHHLVVKPNPIPPELIQSDVVVKKIMPIEYDTLLITLAVPNPQLMHEDAHHSPPAASRPNLAAT